MSPAGARGIAQFMPGTASARGLADPFDPESAIPKAAELLAEMRNQFGNLGLAAAAYNAGPGRRRTYVAGQGDLPGETQNYVSIITQHAAEEWRGKDAAKLTDETVFPDASCVQIVGKFRRRRADPVRAFLVLGAVGRANFRLVQQVSGAEGIRSRKGCLCRDPRRRAADGARRTAAQPRLPPLLPRARAGAVASAGRTIMHEAGAGRRRLRRAARAEPDQSRSGRLALR